MSIILKSLIWRIRRLINSRLLLFVLLPAFFLIINLYFLENRLRVRSDLWGRKMLELPGNLVGFASLRIHGLPRGQLSAFYDTFPLQDFMLDAITELNTSAQDQKLSFYQGSYRLVNNELVEVPLVRYEINLPMKGSYSAVRGFISQTLLQTPTLSLDGISLRRSNANDLMVEADLRMTLYLRPE